MSDFDYYAVLDFEATCCRKGSLQESNEVIEFPTVRQTQNLPQKNARNLPQIDGFGVKIVDFRPKHKEDGVSSMHDCPRVTPFRRGVFIIARNFCSHKYPRRKNKIKHGLHGIRGRCFRGLWN